MAKKQKVEENVKQFDMLNKLYEKDIKLGLMVREIERIKNNLVYLRKINESNYLLYSMRKPTYAYTGQRIADANFYLSVVEYMTKSQMSNFRGLRLDDVLDKNRPVDIINITPMEYTAQIHLQSGIIDSLNVFRRIYKDYMNSRSYESIEDAIDSLTKSNKRLINAIQNKQ